MTKGSFPTGGFAGLRTPFYYYDLPLLRRTLDALCEAWRSIPRAEVHYAVKANHNPVLLRLISSYGLGADCVSGGEIKAALQAGFPAQKVVFAGVGKADWEILLALEAGIACFNVESLAELEVIQQLAAAKNRVANVALRVNPDVGAHTHAHITTGLAENKFGIALESLGGVVELAAQMSHIRLTGLHFHVGSQITDMGDFAALCNRINDLLSALESRRMAPAHINVGGGLGVDYAHPDRQPIPDFRTYFRTFHSLIRRNPEQTLHFEPGRSVVAQCGTLVSRVLYVKQGTNKQFAVLDAGMTDLIRPALYQAVHKMENISGSGPTETYDVVGPVCESSDVFGKAIDLNRVERGHLVAIRTAGAYGESMASQYNCRPLPASHFSNEFHDEDLPTP